jgi:hypothetical protein
MGSMNCSLYRPAESAQPRSDKDLLPETAAGGEIALIHE